MGRTLLLGILLWPFLPSPAAAAHGHHGYPKVGLITTTLGALTEAQLDTLSWYDLGVFFARPERIREIRDRNPDMECLFSWMPQNIYNWCENDSFWYPDTTWSLIHLCEFYAKKNDWYLYTVDGNKIQQWDGYVANWTRYCPKGTYGTSRGLNYVEWLTRVAIPRMVAGNNGAWPPWGSHTGGYDGFMFETMVDCMGSWGNPDLARADPDRDGQIEGVSHACSVGGDQDSLSILMREMNEIFHPCISQIQDQGVRVMLNAGNRYMGPTWRTDVGGAKLEGWLSWYHPSHEDWWDWFYALRSQDGRDIFGPGYYWAENNMHHTGVDSLEGWDQSLLEVMPKPDLPPEQCEHLKRWGFGTALLGNGYFTYTMDQVGLFWQPEYEYEFGRPETEFFKQRFGGGLTADTTYVRIFTKGYVEVNPQDHVVHNIPAQDCFFGFWRVVKEFAIAYIDEGTYGITFTVPAAEPSPIDGYDLVYADFPITADNWDQATPYPGNPIQGDPGSVAEAVVSGLDPGLPYYFAIRSQVSGRLEPEISNLTMVQPAGFIRGDVDGSGLIDLSDPLYNLAWLTGQGPAPPCLDAADDDDSGTVDLSDPIYALNYQFCGGPPPPAPFPACGPDPTEDGMSCDGSIFCLRRMERPDGGQREQSPDAIALGEETHVLGETLAVSLDLQAGRDLLGFEAQIRYDPRAARFVGLGGRSDLRPADGFLSARADPATGLVHVGCVSDLKLHSVLRSGRYRAGLLRFVVSDPARLSQGELTLTQACVVVPGPREEHARGEGATVSYRGEVSAHSGPDPLELRIPNPYVPNAPAFVQTKDPSRVGVTIYNATGRLVRRIPLEASGRGTVSFSWDGATDAGGPVESGIYYVRVTAGGHEVDRKLLLLK
jgi:hypothetical protein